MTQGGGSVTRAAADNDGFPKTCCICGGPVVKARDGALRFHMDDVTGEALSWHVEPCEREHGWPATMGGRKTG